ncbi:MAG TPA: LysR family transcriptional regulator, partial [Gammaproteobacteria bacterium]
MEFAPPNLRHLRVVREVAACRSISQAAKRVHLSQPAITQAVAKLEEGLGAG